MTPFPECRHRGAEASPGAAPCHSPRLAGGQLVTPELCRSCYCREPPPRAPLARFDETNLGVGLPGLRFNSSLIDHDGGYLLAYRDGWAGSDVWLTRLDAAFRPTGVPWRLELFHPRQANYGREDPRLFRHDGRVHVAYIGVIGGHDVLHTSVVFARLSTDCSRAEQVWYSHYAGRNVWEKNWQPFSHGARLYAVYSVAPHRVLRIDGEVATMAYQTPTPAPWSGGELRGGAAPVRCGDEFWCFVHDRVEVGGVPTYRTGLYTFEAEQPFRLQRIVPEPILSADGATRPAGQYASVLFACGAVRDGADWVVSHGVHDRWTELHRFRHDELERRLVRVAPPRWWSWREESCDPGIYSAVAGQNEYRLPDRLDRAAVLDVGAHIGSFAHAAHVRGAAVVHCYEPYPGNFRHLEANARHMPGVVLDSEAVGGCRGRGRLPRPEDVAHTAARTVAPDDAGEVRLIGLDEAIVRLAAASPSGRVTLLKLDCEGCEWPALEAATRLDLVDAIAGEYHLTGTDYTLRHLTALLERAGFTPEVIPPTPPATWGPFFARR